MDLVNFPRNELGGDVSEGKIVVRRRCICVVGLVHTARTWLEASRGLNLDAGVGDCWVGLRVSICEGSALELVAGRAWAHF